MKATFGFLLVVSVALGLFLVLLSEDETHSPVVSESAIQNVDQSIDINKNASLESSSLLEKAKPSNRFLGSNEKSERDDLETEDNSDHSDYPSESTVTQEYFEEYLGDGTTISEEEQGEAPYSVKEAFELDLNDGRRSFDLENKYMEIISASERLSMYALQEADCKHDNCRIAFWVTDDTQRDELATDLIQTLLDHGHPINIEFGSINQEGIAEFYLEASDMLSVTH